MTDEPIAHQFLDFSLMPSEDDAEVYLGLILGNLPTSIEEGESIAIPLGDVSAVVRDFFVQLTVAAQSAKAIKQDMDEYPALTASDAIQRHQVRIASTFN